MAITFNASYEVPYLKDGLAKESAEALLDVVKGTMKNLDVKPAPGCCLAIEAKGDNTGNAPNIYRFLDSATKHDEKNLQIICDALILNLGNEIQGAPKVAKATKKK